MSMTTKFDTPEDVVAHAVSSLMDDERALRYFLTDVMTTVLELDVKREWDSVDNFTMTEGVHGMLAGYLVALTPDLVHQVCEQAGISPDNVDTNAYPEPRPAGDEYLVRDIETGRIAQVLTSEEVPEGELFTLYDDLHGSASWGEVALIEGAAEALVEGRTDDAADCLARLGMELLDEKEN